MGQQETVLPWWHHFDMLIRRCHICKQIRNVHYGYIPVFNCNITHMKQEGTFMWRLCMKCIEGGWRPNDLSNCDRKFLNSQNGQIISV
jgi:hypothetical protein